MTCMYIFNARRVLIFEHLIVTIGKKLNFTLESSMKQKTDTWQIKQILDISIIAHVFTLLKKTKILLKDAPIIVCLKKKKSQKNNNLIEPRNIMFIRQY